ncbi:MAG: YbgA family protein [Thermoflexus sp.]
METTCPGSKPRIGISACLLGERVRFDGGHQRDAFLVDWLGPHVEWVPVCPELEIGLGSPREPLRLVGDPEHPRLVGTRSGADFTRTMQQWAACRLAELTDLDGFILKKNSPSCGLFRVRVYNDRGVAERTGQGIFARVLLERFPWLPVEEEGRLRDVAIREHFIERVFVRWRWRTWVERAPTPHRLIRFHTAHKLILMAHSPSFLARLGCLVAEAGRRWPEALLEYAQLLPRALQAPASRPRRANALAHLMGFLRDQLSREDRQELAEVIEGYRQGRFPLIVPMMLLRHHLRRTSLPAWIHQQAFLDPYPEELGLWNLI